MEAGVVVSRGAGRVSGAEDGDDKDSRVVQESEGGAQVDGQWHPPDLAHPRPPRRTVPAGMRACIPGIRFLHIEIRRGLFSFITVFSSPHSLYLLPKIFR